MADFCKQCSEETFGEDFGDLKGLITKEQEEEGYSVSVLCEGCGPAIVNSEGECISKHCLKSHGAKQT